METRTRDITQGQQPRDWCGLDKNPVDTPGVDFVIFSSRWVLYSFHVQDEVLWDGKTNILVNISGACIELN